MPKKYKIKLSSGRVIGPINAYQVSDLYKKNHLDEEVLVQDFPRGDWGKLIENKELVRFIQNSIKDKKPVDDVFEPTELQIHRAKSNLKTKQPQTEKPIESELRHEDSSSNMIFEEFAFNKENLDFDVDYEALEKKIDEEKKALKKKDQLKSNNRRTVDSTKPKTLIKSNKEPIEKTKINLEALKWFKEEEKKKRKAEEEKLRVEKEKAILEKIEMEPSISFDEKTGMLNRKDLLDLKKEAVAFEKEIKKEAKKLRKLEDSNLTEEEYEEDIEGGPKKKKMSLIVAFAFITVFYFLLEEDDVSNDFKPKYLNIQIPFINDTMDAKKSEELFRKGKQYFRKQTYLGKLQAYKFFNESLRYKFKDNDALGFIILISGELFDNVDPKKKTKSAENLFKLIEISRSKKLTDINTAIGTSLFYKNNKKLDSAILTLEKFGRLSNVDIYVYSVLLSLIIENGDVEQTDNIYEKIKDFSNKPVITYLALFNYYRSNEMIKEFEASLKEALKRYPQSVAILLSYAELLLKNNNLKELKKVLLKIVKLNFEYSPKYYSKYLEINGIVLGLSNKPKQAARLLKEAQTYYDFPELQSRLASLEVGGGSLAEKLILESKANDLVNKSKTFVRSYDWENAFKEALKATDLGYRSIPAELNLADIQIKRGYYEYAIERLYILKEENPVNPEVSFLLIKALYEANKLDEAQLEVGNISNTKLRTHHLFNSTAGHFYARDGNDPLAIKFLTSSTRENPLRDEDFFLMAKIFMKNRQYKKSKEKLYRAISLDPNNIEYKSLYGKILFELDGAETAIGYLSTLLDDLKDNPRIMGDLAISYYKNGQISMFNDVKKRIENLKSSDPAFYEFMIRASMIEENVQNQIKFANKLLNINPGDVKTRMLLGQAYFSQGQYQKAIESYEKVIGRLSTYPRVHYYLAKVYITLRDYKKAIKVAELEKKYNPEIYEGYFIYGEILRLKGTRESLTQAVKNFEKAISLSPRSVETLMALGWIKLNQNHYEIARELYLRAKRYEPANPQIRKQLGFVFQGIGQSGLAIEEFQTYLDLFPNAPDRSSIKNQIQQLSR